MFRYLTITLFFTIVSTVLQSQEICDNALDDDGDGLIDLNDDDCICEALAPTSMIPNPSFEDMICCPETESELNCAVSWIQASIPTTDYVHTCGILANEFLLGYAAPQPFPDGNGGVGFRDGKPGNSNFKEYVGACLERSTEVGTEYRIDFYVGFQDIAGSREFNLGLFMGERCEDLPFGTSSNTFGCPTNGPGYDQIGELFVSGVDEWINVVFEFTATKEYEVIVLGPACAENPNFQLNPYFYMDDITIAESDEWQLPIVEVAGDLCEGTLTLSTLLQDDATYQWYLNGVALIGVTDPEFVLSPDAEEGLYSIVTTNSDGCYISDEYLFERISFEGDQYVSICEGEEYNLGQQTYSEAGEYVYEVVTPNACDSTIYLTIEVNEHSEAELDAILCDGELFSLFDLETTEGGSHVATTTNSVGCDSIITVDITLVEPSEGVDLADRLELELGDEVRIEPVFFDLSIETWEWTNSDGEILSTIDFVDGYLPIENETIYVEVADENGCIDRDSVQLRLTLNYQLDAPNVMLIGDSANGFFKPFMSRKFEEIELIQIFDRWGNLIFEDRGITEFNLWPGWDGSFNGQPVQIGVYAYVVHARAINQEVVIKAGDITVLR